MPVVSLDDCSLNTSGDGNTLTIVLSDNNNTTCNPGFMASVLTVLVRVHGAMSEFFNKFRDHENVTFEETDGGLDRSHESLVAAFNTKEKVKHTVDDCAMYCGDWEELQRHRHDVHVWPDLAPKRRTNGSTTLLQGKVLFHVLSEVFMPLCKSWVTRE